MTTITVNESDRIIIAESLEGWIEYRFSDIPGNEKEIYLHIETDRPAIIWQFAFYSGKRVGIHWHDKLITDIANLKKEDVKELKESIS